MSEYISREQLKAALKVLDIGIWSDIADIVDGLPVADVAPVVHGRWDCGDDMFEYAICSACKWDSGEAWEYAKKNFKFCPVCGAKMHESEEDE